jgi:glycosyltransferase involved in cell wall biosynthesis/SAM-dependent methyltransferase
MAKVSIILTSYNHEKYIAEAINSIIQQTYTDWELIIWDDASSDLSWKIITEYKDSRIRVFKNDVNEGPVFGINKAISEVAQGRYIAIHHSDDIWLLDKLEKQTTYLDAHPEIGAVFSNALAISEDGSPLADKKHLYQTIFLQPNRTRHEWLNHFFFNGNALCHPSILIRKSCYVNCGQYKSYFAQLPDFDMWIRLCQKYEIYILPEKLIKFRVRNNEANTSGNRPEVRIRGAYELYKILDNYRCIENSDDFRRVFDIPEKIKLNTKVDTDYYLARAALNDKNQEATKLFGLNILQELLGNEVSAKIVKRLHNFTIHDFIKLTGSNDILSNERLHTATVEYQSKIQSLASQNIASIENLTSQNAVLVENLTSQNAVLVENLTSQNAVLVENLTSQNAVLVENLTSENRAFQLRINALLKSTSWRVTAPLRFVSRQLSRVQLVCKLAFPAIKLGGGLVCASQKAAKLLLHEGIPGVKRGFRVTAASLAPVPISTFTKPMAFTGNNDYVEWVRQFDTLTEIDIANMHATQLDFVHKPLISVLMPTYNPKTEWLIEAIESVRKQVYQHWELCIADDASPNPAISEILKRYAGQDTRIKIVLRNKNGHISAASNSALELVTGQWVALLDHDDLLPEHALFWVAHTINADPNVRLIYSDEDKTDATGRRFDPYFKSDWNLDLFYSQNMFSHLGVYQTALMREVGGFREGYEGSQDYDLALRCIERIDTKQIFHIPRVLYQWRVHADSTALSSDSKPYAMIAGERAINDHFDRTGINAKVKLVGFGYQACYSLPALTPLVSIIITMRNRLDLLRQCIDSIVSKTTYSNYEILIIDNGSNDKVTLSYLKVICESQKDRERIRVVRGNNSFNYSTLNNLAVRHARGEFLALLNYEIEVITPNWLSEMVSHALRPAIGAVGAKLWYPNDTLQHGGIVLGVCGVAGSAHMLMPRGGYGYMGRGMLTQSFSAISSACLVIKKSTYLQFGGLNESDLSASFYDIDFCLRLQEAGFRNIWTPLAELYHHESTDRRSDDAGEKKVYSDKEKQYMKQRWGALLQKDPCYSPNLTLDGNDFSYAWPSRVAMLPSHANLVLHMPQSVAVDRVAKTMFGLRREGAGLEIGPSHNPIAPKKAGYNVKILDHASASDLRIKYAGDPAVKLENIEEVDFVWRGEQFTKLIGRENCYDWIVASHVIEHVTDLLAFLQQCEKLLTQDGIISLVIPDKRYCFDYFRWPSNTGDVLDAFISKRSRHTPGTVFDHYANFAQMGEKICWSEVEKQSIEIIHGIDLVKDYWLKATNNREYIDAHSWRFTPSSFRIILNDLQQLNLTNLVEIDSFDTEGFEFWIKLSHRKDTAVVYHRQTLCQKMIQEVEKSIRQ